MITADPAALSPIAGAETLGAALSGTSTVFESVVTEPTDTAVILYTSGTAGQPKGAELSHANTMMNVLTVNRLFESWPATDSHVVTLPLFHTFGATVQLHAGFSMAATLHLVPRFDARQVLALMQQERITFFAGVPTMWWGLLGALDGSVDVERIATYLRVGVSGGAALPIELLHQIQQKLDVTVLEGYGLSETSPVVTFSDPDGEPRAGSIGVPIWGVEVKLINDDWSEVTAPGQVGEIAVKGHNVMKGYHARPDATAEVIRGGWFRTGDLARRDEDGYYYIVDRTKDLIHPRWLEHLPSRGRGGDAHAPRSQPGRRHRRPARVVRRGGQGLRRPRAWRGGHRRGHGRVGQAADGELQVPAHRGNRRGASDDCHRQDPQARAAVRDAIERRPRCQSTSGAYVAR